MQERPLSERWDQTIASIRGTEIVPVKQEGGAFFQGIAIVFRIVPPANFDVELLDGLDVRLVLGRGRNTRTGQTIFGKISPMEPRPSFGTTRSFRFDPRHIEELEFVQFSGKKHWSNVELVTLMTPRGPIVCTNRLCHHARPS